MAKNRILGMLSLGSCAHQFSWPRRSSNGEYYQFCVLCGDEYSYDWEAMQRLGRKPPDSAGRGAVPAKAAVRWHPRARRMRLSGPVRFREPGNDSWSDGELKNISQSGLLFTTDRPLLEGTRIEIELEMPPEICGSEGRRVRCDAQIVRMGSGESTPVCAAQIFDYVFVDSTHLVEGVELHRGRGRSRWSRRSKR